MPNREDCLECHYHTYQIALIADQNISELTLKPPQTAPCACNMMLNYPWRSEKHADGIRTFLIGTANTPQTFVPLPQTVPLSDTYEQYYSWILTNRDEKGQVFLFAMPNNAGKAARQHDPYPQLCNQWPGYS